MTDAEIMLCRQAIKRIAWLETREARVAALNELPAQMRGVVERGVYKIFPVVQKKRRTRSK